MAFTDDFTQASPPQNLEARSGWSRSGGAAGDAIISGLANNRLSAAPSGESAFLCTSQASADHYTQAAVYADCGSFICVRLTDANNFIGFRYSGGSWQVYKRSGGSFTQLGTDYTATLTGGDVGRLEAVGNTITFTVNGTLRCLGAGVTESLNNTEVRQGLVARSSGGYPWIDDFEAGTAGGDTTAPTLTSPVGTGGTGTCSGSVSTNEANGTLYCVATASATAPSAAQVKAGQDHTGAAALRVVSQAVSTTGAQTVASGACSAGTRYLHFMHEDAAANQSAVASSASFTVTAADTTAPTLTSPTGAATGKNTATGTVSTDEGNGTLYAVVTSSATAPTGAQVRAGQDHTGAAASWAGSQVVSSTGTKTFNATGLTAGAVRYFHYQHRDAASNDSTVSSSAAFTLTIYGFRFSTLTGGQFGTIVGALTDIGAEAASTSWTMFVHNDATRDVILNTGALTIGATGRLPDFFNGTLDGATYFVSGRRSDGAWVAGRLTATV